MTKLEQWWLYCMLLIIFAFLLFTAFGFGRAFERKTYVCEKIQCYKYILEEQEKGYDKLIKRLLK